MSDLVSISRAQQAPALAGVDSSLLASLISAASAVVENWLRRTVIRAQRVDQVDGSGTEDLLLEEPDLVSIDACTIRDAADVTTTIPATDFRFSARSGAVWFIGSPTNTAGWDYFPAGRENISITYTCGLCADQASVPAPIVQAVVETMVRMLGSSTNDPTVVMERLGDYSVQRNTSAQVIEALPVAVLGALGVYRNRIV